MLSCTKRLRSYGVDGPRSAVMPRTRYETGPRRTSLDIGTNSSVGSVPFETNGAKESVMPFSPWPMPSVPDVDLASFALRHADRLADSPALIDEFPGTSAARMPSEELDEFPGTSA